MFRDRLPGMVASDRWAMKAARLSGMLFRWRGVLTGEDVSSQEVDALA